MKQFSHFFMRKKKTKVFSCVEKHTLCMHMWLGVQQITSTMPPFEIGSVKKEEQAAAYRKSLCYFKTKEYTLFAKRYRAKQFGSEQLQKADSNVQQQHLFPALGENLQQKPSFKPAAAGAAAAVSKKSATVRTLLQCEPCMPPHPAYEKAQEFGPLILGLKIWRAVLLGRPQRFELFCKILCEKVLKLHVQETRLSKDGGIDLVMSKNKWRNKIYRFAQCKRSLNTTSVRQLRELVGAKDYYEATHGHTVDKLYFFTASCFSAESVAYANAQNIDLYDKHRIEKCLAVYGNDMLDALTDAGFQIVVEQKKRKREEESNNSNKSNKSSKSNSNSANKDNNNSGDSDDDKSSVAPPPAKFRFF